MNFLVKTWIFAYELLISRDTPFHAIILISTPSASFENSTATPGSFSENFRLNHWSLFLLLLRFLEIKCTQKCGRKLHIRYKDSSFMNSFKHKTIFGRLGSRKTGLSPPYFNTDRSKAVLQLWFLAVTCSCCPYLYFGSAIMLVTFLVNFR